MIPQNGHQNTHFWVQNRNFWVKISTHHGEQKVVVGSTTVSGHSITLNNAFYMPYRCNYVSNHHLLHVHHPNHRQCSFSTSYILSKITIKNCILDPKMGVLMTILRYHLLDQPYCPTTPGRLSRCLWRVNAGKW